MTTPEERAKRAAYMRKWNRSPAGIAYSKRRKQAHANYNRKWNEEHIERRRAQNRESYIRHRDKRSEYAKEQHVEDPRVRKARWAAYAAAKNGTIVRPSKCSVCLIDCQPEAHHHKGYEPEFWLDVVWVCTKCHRAAH